MSEDVVEMVEQLCRNLAGVLVGALAGVVSRVTQVVILKIETTPCRIGSKESTSKRSVQSGLEKGFYAQKQDQRRALRFVPSS